MRNSLRIAFAALLFASFASIAVAAPTNPWPKPTQPGGGVTAPTNPWPKPTQPGGGGFAATLSVFGL